MGKKLISVYLLVSAVLLLIALPVLSSAEIGVGVGTGKIRIDKPIKSGGIYDLPPVLVYNTGDVTARYAMHVTLNETQKELKPNPEWFSFHPNSFDLKPGRSQLVTPTFSPPINTPPGKYFGYLEAYPDATVNQGSATIGIAAATKLYFEVESSNTLLALLNRAKALYMHYAPWTYIVTILIGLVFIRAVMRRYLRINIQITSPIKQTKTETNKVEEKESKVESLVTNTENDSEPEKNNKKKSTKKKGTKSKTSKNK